MDVAAPTLQIAPGDWPIRILVTGWRAWPRGAKYIVEENLTAWAAHLRGQHERRPIVVVHGKCPYGGVDLYTDEWARGQGPLVWPEPHEAPWASMGKRAGMVRNQHMVNLGAAICLGFPGPLVDPTKPGGTRNCMGLAKAAGIYVSEVEWSDHFLSSAA